MSGEFKRLKIIQDQVNDISPSFCIAKWSQVTLHLHNGRTHSCHHPNVHEVPLEELENNPSALHNTNHKKERRKEMLNGKRCEECQYCWNVEDLDGYKNGEFYSDRVIKSGADWSMPMLDKIKNGNWDDNVNPLYLEVSFSNVCNFKCSYCSPIYSSRWVEEAEKHGAYPTTSNFGDINWLKQTNQLPIHHKQHNPYVEAFWKWWPDLIKDLKVFRVTGGEPLMSKDTFKALDYLYEHNPNPNLEFAINTNGCVPDKIYDSFIDKMKLLKEENKIGKTHIYTSVDSYGKQAEYGREGLDYNKWYNNIDRLMTELPDTKVTIMCTTNILSITNYKKMLMDVLHLKKKHFNDNRKVPITVDAAILRHPHHQCAAILPKEYHHFMDDSLTFMKENQEGTNGNDYFDGFFDFEIARLERFVEFMQAGPNEAENINLEYARADFYRFMNEHDKRRGSNFLETFPELKSFYDMCGSLANATV